MGKEVGGKGYLFKMGKDRKGGPQQVVSYGGRGDTEGLDLKEKREY